MKLIFDIFHILSINTQEVKFKKENKITEIWLNLVFQNKH
jgi:hypothetical protein